MSDGDTHLPDGPYLCYECGYETPLSELPKCPEKGCSRRLCAECRRGNGGYCEDHREPPEDSSPTRAGDYSPSLNTDHGHWI